MAVEANHLNLFPPQFVQSRENLMNTTFHQGHVIHPYNQLPQMRFPATLPDNQPFYQQAKTSVNSESGLTCSIPPASRKRGRESAGEFYAGASFPAAQKSISVVGGNVLPQIHQFQSEIDAIISDHAKKIRLELHQRQKQQAKMFISAIGDSVMKKFNEKDDQIQNISRSNQMLQERVRNLHMEIQLWRDLANSNEATANSLRTDLQQALAQFGGATAAADEEVESCGSSDHGRDIDGAESTPYKNGETRRCCRRCGGRPCSVLLLPCRHLCLCGVCGSGSGSNQLQTCPVCHTSMTATLHVNMS